MTFDNFRVAACISCFSLLGGLSACSSTVSNGSSSDAGGGIVKQPTGGDDGGAGDDAGGPPVGTACTTSSNCTAPAVCSNGGSSGPLYPTPICIAQCTPAASADEIAFCGPDTLPGAGFCDADPSGGGVCLPVCYVAAGVVNGCLANDVCQVLTTGADPTTTTQTDLYGYCQPGCTADSQCPTGSSCDTYAAECLTTVTAPTSPVGASCDPSSTTPTCACLGATGSTTGFCSSQCVTGGPTCPQPGAGAAGDGGVDGGTTSALPFVCSAQLGGFNTIDAGISITAQPAGLYGLCLPACDQNTDCIATLGASASCQADPAGGTHKGICVP